MKDNKFSIHCPICDKHLLFPCDNIDMNYEGQASCLNCHLLFDIEFKGEVAEALAPVNQKIK